MRHILFAFALALFACGTDDGLDDIGEVQLVSYGQPTSAGKAEEVAQAKPAPRRVAIMETCAVDPKPEPQPCAE